MLVIEARTIGNITILDLSGQMDEKGTIALKERIQEVRQQGSLKILLNCADVVHISSAHQAQLLTPIRVLTSIKGKIGFYGLSVGAHRVLKTAMFYSIIHVFDTEQEALDAFES